MGRRVSSRGTFAIGVKRTFYRWRGILHDFLTHKPNPLKIFQGAREWLRADATKVFFIESILSFVTVDCNDKGCPFLCNQIEDAKPGSETHIVSLGLWFFMDTTYLLLMDTACLLHYFSASLVNEYYLIRKPL